MFPAAMKLKSPKWADWQEFSSSEDSFDSASSTDSYNEAEFIERTYKILKPKFSSPFPSVRSPRCSDQRDIPSSEGSCDVSMSTKESDDEEQPLDYTYKILRPKMSLCGQSSASPRRSDQRDIPSSEGSCDVSMSTKESDDEEQPIDCTDKILRPKMSLCGQSSTSPRRSVQRDVPSSEGSCNASTSTKESDDEEQPVDCTDKILRPKMSLCGQSSAGGAAEKNRSVSLPLELLRGNTMSNRRQDQQLPQGDAGKKSHSASLLSELLRRSTVTDARQDDKQAEIEHSALQGGQHSALQGGQQFALQGGQHSAAQGGQHSAAQGGQHSAVQGGQHSAAQDGQHSAVHGGQNSAVQGGQQFALHGGQQFALHSGQHFVVQGGQQFAVQGGQHSAAHGGQHSAAHGGQHSAAHGGQHSALQGGQHSALQGGQHSAVQGGQHSALQGGLHSAVHGGQHSAVHGGQHSAVQGGQHSALQGGQHSALQGGQQFALQGGHYSALQGGQQFALQGGHYSALQGGQHSAVRGGQHSAVQGGQHSAVQGGQQFAVQSGQHSAVQGGQQFAVQGGQHSAAQGGLHSAAQGGQHSAAQDGQHSAVQDGQYSAVQGGQHSAVQGGLTEWQSEELRQTLQDLLTLQQAEQQTEEQYEQQGDDWSRQDGGKLATEQRKNVTGQGREEHEQHLQNEYQAEKMNEQEKKKQSAHRTQGEKKMRNAKQRSQQINRRKRQSENKREKEKQTNEQKRVNHGRPMEGKKQGEHIAEDQGMIQRAEQWREQSTDIALQAQMGQLQWGAYSAPVLPPALLPSLFCYPVDPRYQLASSQSVIYVFPQQYGHVNSMPLYFGMQPAGFDLSMNTSNQDSVRLTEITPENCRDNADMNKLDPSLKKSNRDGTSDIEMAESSHSMDGHDLSLNVPNRDSPRTTEVIAETSQEDICCDDVSMDTHDLSLKKRNRIASSTTKVPSECSGEENDLDDAGGDTGSEHSSISIYTLSSSADSSDLGEDSDQGASDGMVVSSQPSSDLLDIPDAVNPLARISRWLDTVKCKENNVDVPHKLDHVGNNLTKNINENQLGDNDPQKHSYNNYRNVTYQNCEEGTFRTSMTHKKRNMKETIKNRGGKTLKHSGRSNSRNNRIENFTSTGEVPPPSKKMKLSSGNIQEEKLWRPYHPFARSTEPRSVSCSMELGMPDVEEQGQSKVHGPLRQTLANDSDDEEDSDSSDIEIRRAIQDMYAHVYESPLESIERIFRD